VAHICLFSWVRPASINTYAATLPVIIILVSAQSQMLIAIHEYEVWQHLVPHSTVALCGPIKRPEIKTVLTTQCWFGVTVTAFATSSPISSEIGYDLWQVYHPGIYPGPLSLAIPPWVGAMSTRDGFGHLWKETAPLKLRTYGAL